MNHSVRNHSFKKKTVIFGKGDLQIQMLYKYENMSNSTSSEKQCHFKPFLSNVPF